MSNELDRRSFLKISALAGALIGLPGLACTRSGKTDIDAILEKISLNVPGTGKSVMGMAAPPIDQVKVGVIGLGNRGSGMIYHVQALFPDKATITAICDIRQKQVEEALSYLKENGQNPAVYSGTEDAWKEMVQRDDIDLVLIMTNWKLHTPMCVYAMQQGKHVAVEVPAAITVEECWQLVNTSEETQRHCMMMENVCYGSEELWVLNMVKKGVFGTITYAEAAYIHNLLWMLFGDSYYHKWRIRHHVKHDGNLYPTHGLGPVAWYMDIQRGDHFEYLTSMSSLQASLTEYAKTVDPENEFYNRTDFKHGDLNTSLIKTSQGRMITLKHDVATPRPYNRINAIAGTMGYHEGYPSRLAVNEYGHGWVEEEVYREYREKYEHPIWKNMRVEIEKHGGHGGMDFVLVYRIIDNLNKGLPLDQDVYDAAAWSVITPLSEISVELEGTPVKFPDFSRGKWQEPRELQVFKR